MADLPQEQPIVGLSEIAKYMPVSFSLIAKQSKYLQEQGVFLAMIKGKIPKRRKVIFSYPSLIQRWLITHPEFLMGKGSGRNAR